MLTNDRLKNLEQTSSFLTNSKIIPEQSELRAVRKEIFDEINSFNEEIKLLKKRIESLDLIIRTLYNERNTNV